MACLTGRAAVHLNLDAFCAAGGVRKGMGNYQWNNNTVDTFSAACFHFAEGLAEIAEQKNETAVPMGLISSSWGGTVVEVR
jgi:hypothetical protein